MGVDAQQWYAMQWIDWLRGWWRGSNLGQRGERLAERQLRKSGYRILARNIRYQRGEIDLIALDGRTIVFVEVKTRTSDQRGEPAETVDEHKQRLVARAALVWLRRKRLLDYPARFDVVSIVWHDDGRPPQLAHYRAAFQLPSDLG